MSIRHLPASDYVTLPWKNGTGSTDEVCLLPEEATRDAFEVRVSRATIAEPGLFSAFAGVERTITLIEGAALSLDFGTHRAELAPLQPYTFDSGLTPHGNPPLGPVRVLNVMAARNAWKLGPARILTRGEHIETAQDEVIVLFAVRGGCEIAGSSQTVSLQEGDSALLDEHAFVGLLPDAAVLAVPLKRGQVRD